MRLYSTNNPKNIVSLKEAVLHAFPEDRGLYLPCDIPNLGVTFFQDIGNRSFQEIAFHVSTKLFEDDVPRDEIEKLVYSAFDFPVPLIQLNEKLSILELFHGPTLAFKDFGARFMSRLMGIFLKDRSQKTTILVATSGDTGGAVASGFHGSKEIDVIVLYPKGKVSALQKLQLTTWGDNITAIEIDGVFDDCQRLVKQAFLDSDLKEQYNFSSANSINIARLIPQSFYYLEAFKQAKSQEDLVFIVPSGNLGNLSAGILAHLMGMACKILCRRTQ